MPARLSARSMHIFISIAAIALLAFLAALVLPLLLHLPAAALWHLLFAAGVMPLIFAAMLHFTPVLTRSRGARGAVAWLPPLVLVVGLGAFAGLAFAPDAVYRLVAPLALLLAAALWAWMWRRARTCLAPPHPGLYWYLAACACLMLALAAVAVSTVWPAAWPLLRRVHLHLNLLGFIGLTALGTLQVLLPTVRNVADARAAARLRADLKWALSGTLAVAAGAASWTPLALFGFALWSIPVVRFARASLRLHGRALWSADSAAPALAGALFGLVLVLASGVAHALGLLPASASLRLYVAAFLLPLVTGATSHLLPLWLHPERPPAALAGARARLQRGGRVRTVVFVGSGLLWAGGAEWAVYAAAGALAVYLLQLLEQARD